MTIGFWLCDHYSRMEQNQQQAELFEEQKRNFEHERQELTKAAIQLSEERVKFEVVIIPVLSSYLH